jgi:hypothetical protein
MTTKREFKEWVICKIPKFEEQLEVFALIESANRAVNVYNPSVN